MAFLDKLERKLGRFTFPYLLQFLIFGQILVFGAIAAGLVYPQQLVMNARAVMSGEVWRLFTFMVVPLRLDLLWFAIGAYITYLIGGSLEREWGEVRFSLYVGLGWLATVLVSWLVPSAAVTNGFILGSLTLAFARLFPDVEFLIFFLLPVKVKYIGYVVWGGYGLAAATQPMEVKLQVMAGVLPFFVFFGPELLFMLKEQKRTRAFREKVRTDPGEAFHTCSRCGATEKSHPERAFRYKSEACYCEVCLQEEPPA
jgi:hypothetical protein